MFVTQVSSKHVKVVLKSYNVLKVLKVKVLIAE